MCNSLLEYKSPLLCSASSQRRNLDKEVQAPHGWDHHISANHHQRCTFFQRTLHRATQRRKQETVSQKSNWQQMLPRMHRLGKDSCWHQMHLHGQSYQGLKIIICTIIHCSITKFNQLRFVMLLSKNNCWLNLLKHKSHKRSSDIIHQRPF